MNEHLQDQLRLVREHGHRSVAEVGQCPDCHQHAIASVANGPFAFGVAFWIEESHPDNPEAFPCDGCGEPAVPLHALPDYVAFIRTWDPDPEEAMTTAWATGCNPGGSAAAVKLVLEAVEDFGPPLFKAIERPGPRSADLIWPEFKFILSQVE